MAGAADAGTDASEGLGPGEADAAVDLIDSAGTAGKVGRYRHAAKTTTATATPHAPRHSLLLFFTSSPYKPASQFDAGIGLRFRTKGRDRQNQS
jgi:hypothetical protein